jgi:hypothetical protein
MQQYIRGILIVLAVLSIGLATFLTVVGFNALAIGANASVATLFFVAGIAFIELAKIIKVE